MTLSRLPTRCKFCRVKFTAEERGLRLHPSCIEPWTAAFQEKQKRKAVAERKAKERVEKALDRKKREGLKRIPDLIAEAQKVFNKWIRTRDEKEPCISCGAPPPDLSGLHAGRDAGHYRSIGSASHLRFHEDNCHAQCVKCNQWKAGNAVDYRLGLVLRMGVERVEALEASNAPHKWERDELIAIRAMYVQKLKKLRDKE
jgi:Bacteriophage Lambda NinG protein